MTRSGDKIALASRCVDVPRGDERRLLAPLREWAKANEGFKWRDLLAEAARLAAQIRREGAREAR